MFVGNAYMVDKVGDDPTPYCWIDACSTKLCGLKFW